MHPTDVTHVARLARLQDGSSVADRVLGGFQLVGELGRGGMGVVYLARDESLGRFVAIKVLNPVRLDQPTAMERLRREAKALSQLAHPGIVTVYALGSSPEGPYIVMEYVSGAALSELISGGLPDRRRWVSLIAQAAEALTFAHRAGVVHRDIKPSNLLLVRSGASDAGALEATTLKVIDFGLAALASDSQDRLTREGAYVGTPSFASPEQALGRPVDGRADLYSLAVVALQGLTTARLTRTGLDAGTPLAAALDHPSGLGPHVEHVFERALALHPETRHGTPVEFVEALREALQVGDDAERAPAKTPSGWTLQSASGFHAVLHVALGSCADGPGARRTASLESALDAIGRGDGAIASVADDTIVGVFGAATGTLHPAVQAVRVGLDLQARLSLEPSLQARVAVAGTFSIVEAAGGRLVRASGAAFREARELASATRASLLVTPAVYARVRGIVVGGPLTSVDGVECIAVEPAQVERDLGEPDFYGTPIPFVGCREEMVRLLALVDRAVASQVAQAAVVTGQQGLGRTRLLRELAAELGRREQRYLLEFVRLVGDDGLEEGLLRCVRTRAGIEETDSETAIRLKLDFGLRRAGVSLGSRDDALLDAVVELARGRQRDVVGTLAAYWTRLAAQSPVVVMVDDLHLGGRDAETVLQKLLLALRGVPLALIATTVAATKGPPSAGPGPWGPGVATLELGALTGAEIRELATSLLERVDPFPTAICEDIVRVAGGVPARAEQRLHDLVDRGVLIPRVGPWAVDETKWSSEGKDDELRRLDDLSAEARLVLEAVAVAGDPCWREQLGFMLQAPCPVQELVDHGLVRLSGDRRLSGGQPLELAVGWLRAGLISGVAHARRVALHERAASWLSDRMTLLGPSMIATLVRHLEAAGLDLQAFEAARRGAERAARASMPARAVLLYEWAARLAARTGKPQDPLVAPWLTQLLLAGELLRVVEETDRDGRATPELFLVRGKALERLGRFEEAERAYESAEASAGGGLTARRAAVAAAALASKRGEAGALDRLTRLSETPSGDDVTDSEVHRQLGNALIRATRYSEAEAELERAAVLAEEADDVAAELEAQNALAAAAYFRGELALAESRFTTALRLAQRAQMAQHEALIGNNLAELQLALGEVERASSTAEKALVLYRALGSDEGIADAARIASECASRSGSEEARSLAEESVAAAQRTGVERLIRAAAERLAGVA